MRKRSKSRDRRDDRKDEKKEKEKTPPALPRKEPKKDTGLLGSKTGGAYIPPAKLRMMQQSITDKASEAYQRLAWEALKKSINGLINKVNSPNIAVICKRTFCGEHCAR